MAQNKVFVGIDVAKRHLDVAVPDGDLRVANDAAGRRDLLARLEALRAATSDAIVVALEASGGYEKPIVAELVAAGFDTRLVEPRRVRLFAGASGIEAKNDRLDARVIARFAAAMPTRPVQIDAAAEALAELVAARRRLREEGERARQSLERVSDAALARVLRRRLRQVEADILLIEKRIAERVDQDERLARRAALMRGVPGVGPVLAATLLAEMPELGSLDRRQVAALAGLAPYANESGGSRKPRRTRGGRKEPRNVLYMAALSAGRGNPDLAVARERLRAKGKAPKVVIVAIMRKLLTILNAILRDNVEWSPRHPANA